MKRIYIIIIIIFFVASLEVFSSLNIEIDEEIFINNQSVLVEDMVNLLEYIQSKEDKSLEISNINNLSVDIDLSGNINIKLNNDLVFGYLERENYSFTVIEDTVACFFDKDASNGEYQVKADYLNQEINGLYLSKYFHPGEKMRIGVTGKLLNGVRLKKDYFEGIIEKEGEKNFFSGRRVTLDSDFYKMTDLYEVDFNSNGWGLDLCCQWLITDTDKITISLENIYSRIIWENVFTEYMNYNKASLGLYSNDMDGSSSSGIFNFNDYKTTLPEKYKVDYFTDKYNIGIDYYKEKFYPYFKYQTTDFLNLGFYKDMLQLSFNAKWVNIDLKSDQVDITSAEKAAGAILIKFPF